jgi:hypothetical protein
MGILNNIFNSLTSRTKKINTSQLPSMGLFYPDDFIISIKKATIEDILEYERDFKPDDMAVIIEVIKRIICKNIVLPKKYNFNWLKSIDIVYVFLEIVKWTNSKNIEFNLYNNVTGEAFKKVNFGSDSFDYFNTDKLMKYYNPDTMEFIIDDWKYSMPSIGIEESIMEYLHSKRNDGWDAEMLNNVDYNFMYFLGNKEKLTLSEMDNIITIFNWELDDESKYKINQITETFKDLSKYSVVWEGTSYEISNKIDLSKIWE